MALTTQSPGRTERAEVRLEYKGKLIQLLFPQALYLNILM